MCEKKYVSMFNDLEPTPSKIVKRQKLIQTTLKERVEILSEKLDGLKSNELDFEFWLALSDVERLIPEFQILHGHEES